MSDTNVEPTDLVEKLNVAERRVEVIEAEIKEVSLKVVERNKCIAELEDELKHYKDYAGRQMVMSDYQTADQMREALNANKAKVKELEALLEKFMPDYHNCKQCENAECKQPHDDRPTVCQAFVGGR